jgi:hypothetical protein
MTIDNFKKGVSLDFKKTETCNLNWVVYLLVHNKEIVYVGKSSYSGYTRRIKSHMKDKIFDEVYVAQVTDIEQEVFTVERSFISLLQPKYNIADNVFDWQVVQQGFKKLYRKSKYMPVMPLKLKLVFYFYVLAFIYAFTFDVGIIGIASVLLLFETIFSYARARKPQSA